MRLLFDQNISFRIIRLIEHYFPESQQVRALMLENVTDFSIWNYAKLKNFTIVTFDADFYELSTLYGHPPKIIWLRTGNRTTNHLADFLIRKHADILDFINNPELSEIACLELH